MRTWWLAAVVQVVNIMEGYLEVLGRLFLMAPRTWPALLGAGSALAAEQAAAAAGAPCRA